MPHASSARPYPRTRSRDAHPVGEKVVSAGKTAATLLEELTRVDQTSGGSSSVSVSVPGASAENSHSQPLETIFLESCDIAEVEVLFDELPTEITLVAPEALSLKKPASAPRGGPETVTAVPLVSDWPEPRYVPSGRLANPSPYPTRRQQPKPCTDCHHAYTPLTIRQTRFKFLQDMCGPAPVLPELLSAPEPLSPRCDWTIKGGIVGDWCKCPQRPLPTYERRFDGSESWLLEARRQDLESVLLERAAREAGIPVHLYVPKKPVLLWPPPPGFN